MTHKPPRKPEPRKPDKKPLAGLKPQDLRALGIGLELAAVIGGAVFLGHLADQKLGTEPWLTLSGVLFGLTGGCWHALKMSNGGKTPEIPGITQTTKKQGRDKPLAEETDPTDDPPQ